MNIFFSGIGGVGIGSLALVAADAGYEIAGSDPVESLMTRQLLNRNIAVFTNQDGSALRSVHANTPIDRYVYTAALPHDHPELLAAKELGIPTAKRDELLGEILRGKDLKLIAVSGTHGKTTTTGMMVWAFQQLGIPVSYSIGTTLSFGPSGHYDPDSTYFIYECDEFDRNFLHFSPALSLITSIGYDHSDTYPTKDEYLSAFSQFLSQSDHVVGWWHDFRLLPEVPDESTWQLQDDEVASIRLPGEHNRRNATLVLKALEYLGFGTTPSLLESFPGTNRRFEKLGDNLYSDYGHHPTEIAATLQMARELSDHITLVYQPHQNSRQYEIKNLYRNCFKDAETIFWLPTYLSRENPDLPVLTPEELTVDIANRDDISITDMNDELWTMLELSRESGNLVLLMGAGSIDSWVRSRLRD
jgi:UDP-N-acetylmuramate--alanine ligase